MCFIKNIISNTVSNYHQSTGGEAEFDTVEMGDPVGMPGKVKVPRRTIYFANGETMEEYSTDEEEEEEQTAKKEVISVDPVRYWHSKSRITTIN